jgi:outer membrane protein assembly factor BamB
MGVFSLTSEGQLRWQDVPDPTLFIFNASHNQRAWFTDSRMVFGFMATTGPPRIYAYDFQGNQTNHIDYTCVSSPKTDPMHLLVAGVCGVQAIDLESDSIVWSVDFGPVNMLPIAGTDGVVYSGSWHGPVSAISPQGQVLWTSPDAGLQRTLAVSDEHGVFLYVGENFGEPNWLGAVDTGSGQPLWQVPFETVGGHNELGWSNEAAFSPDGTVAYFTTRFTSNGAPGRLYAVRIAETSACPGDLDGSGAVGTGDLLQLLSAWGSAGGDLDGDGTTSTQDLLILLSAWGPCP